MNIWKRSYLYFRDKIFSYTTWSREGRLQRRQHRWKDWAPRITFRGAEWLPTITSKYNSRSSWGAMESSYKFTCSPDTPLFWCASMKLRLTNLDTSTKTICSWNNKNLPVVCHWKQDAVVHFDAPFTDGLFILGTHGSLSPATPPPASGWCNLYFSCSVANI